MLHPVTTVVATMADHAHRIVHKVTSEVGISCRLADAHCLGNSLQAMSHALPAF